MLTTRELTVHRFPADADGCAAYAVTGAGTRQTAVIDPRLDQVDEIAGWLAREALEPTWVLDTHTHADHLSGVRRLADRTGARMVVHEASKSRLPARRVAGGQLLPLGNSALEVLDAPGHTPDSMALHIGGHLFTGDALLAGSAGRTDFMGGSASQLFDTYQSFKKLPGSTVVHPGHDYVGRAETTLEREATDNSAFRQTHREELVRLLDVSKPVPANMPTIVAFNLEQSRASTLTALEADSILKGAQAPRLLDVRTPIEFAGEHIEGAVHVPLDQLEARIVEVPADIEHVVVCRTGVRSISAVQLLQQQGRNARVLTGGMLAWRKAGLPVIEGRKILPLDRQVQLIVGIGVLASVTLGLLVSPWFLGIAAFFGAGLAFAGATGTCGLAVVLSMLPWNQLDEAAAARATCAATCASGPAEPSSACAAGTTQPRSGRQ